MFALLALICFVLAVFNVHVPVSLIALGLSFLAAHLLFGSIGPLPWTWSKRGE